MLTVAEFLERCDGGEGGDADLAPLKALHRLGLPQEALIQLTLQRGESTGTHRQPGLKTQSSQMLF